MKGVEFRPSTISEREEFYTKEFSIKKVINWFKKNHLKVPQICALDAGTDTGIILEKKHKGNMLYFKFKDLKKKIKEYAPEDVYYDRNIYKNPKNVLNKLNFEDYQSQELVFDLDVENMAEEVNNKSLKDLFRIALKMKRELEKRFDRVHIVYSGRGFHLHIDDKCTRKMTTDERKVINAQFVNYPIDPWVSKGFIRLIRMPYSLNSIVSRRVIPVNKKFNIEKTYPKFILE
jgi:DNA primase catalytic subunit